MPGFGKCPSEVFELATDLFAVGDLALTEANRLGANQAEVYLAASRSFTIEVENNSIKTALERRDAGVGVRTVAGKGIGFAYVTTLQRDDVLEAVRTSYALARASVEDPQFVSLPSYDGKYPSVPGLYDKRIAELSSEEAADIIIRMVDATKSGLEGRNVAIEARLNASSGTVAIVNSVGVRVSGTDTSISVFSSPVIKEGNDQTSSFEFQVGRQLKDVNPEWVGSSAAENALRNLGAKTIEGGEMPVLFDPIAVGAVLGDGFGVAVNAEEVQYGRSYISDAFGQEIAAPELHVVDNGFLPGALGSRVFDAEGYPSQKTELLSSGVLKSLLHNSYTAAKDSVENTGNASRASYAGVPGIAPSNLVVMQGRGSQEDLISEIRRGVLCRQTGDRPNMTTGDLSAMIMEGAYIEDGELKHALKGTLIGINMRDLLMRVTRVAADTRSTPDVISPSIVIESAKVTSG
ncbi:MAG: TldD/PmbA family protein [Candidatus Thorarchaeota archaeon]|nr:TldD/PmbA family protein [Candidatus Thorarchaeota archaeon]